MGDREGVSVIKVTEELYKSKQGNNGTDIG